MDIWRQVFQSDHIIFVRDPKNKNLSPKNYEFSTKSLNLLDISYDFNILEYIPRSFTLETNNGESKFNISLLTDTSPIICNLTKQNPEELHYKLDIDDEKNVMGKLEQLYLGKYVVFEKEEIPTLVKITSELGITCCPNYMRQEGFLIDDISDGVQINKVNFNGFIQNQRFKTFNIICNKKKHKCNKFAVIFSKTIREFIANNPNSNSFVYNISNEFDEIQPIIDLFNFKTVSVNLNNVNSIKDLAEDLQIDVILEKVDKNIKEYEKVSQTIDEQQTVVDSIEQLFHLLHHIKEYTIEEASNIILGSFWIQTEEDVLELSAFFLQAIQSDIFLHPYLANLLIVLDQEKNESNYLHILIPTIVTQMMNTFGDSKSFCSFIYNLYKRGIITKEALFEKLKNKNNRNSSMWISSMSSKEDNLNSWFFPELIELNLFNDNCLPRTETEENENRSKYVFLSASINNKNTNNNPDSNKCKNWRSFLKLFYPDKIDVYKEMRDSGEPNEELTKALIHDDIDTFQSLVSKCQINISMSTVPYNIFDDFVTSGKTRYINYAAAYGSVKCFKYLLLNHVNIDSETLKYAVYGGNVEIIKIVSYASTSKTEDTVGIFIPAIAKHSNDLFDWILEQKKVGKDSVEGITFELLSKCAENGNAHSFIEIVDNGYDFSSFYIDLIEKASKNGFYRLAQIICNIHNQKSDEFKNSKSGNKLYSLKQKTKSSKDDFYSSFVNFNNLSIFQLFLEVFKDDQSSIEKCLNCAIKKDSMLFIKYFFEEFITESFKITPLFIFNSLNISLDKSPNELTIYLINTFNRLSPNAVQKLFKFDELLDKACTNNDMVTIKLLVDLINEKNKDKDFTNEFIIAASSNSYEICKYFIDLHVLIDFKRLVTNCLELASTSKEIFMLMITNASLETRELFISKFLSAAIIKKNFDVVEFLLKSNAKCSADDLVNAVNSRDLRMVNLILQYNSKPSFINRVSKEGTALFIAVRNNNLDIVKSLLSIPKINPNLYGHNDQTPFMHAVQISSPIMVDTFINFFGANIQEQAWQLNESLKILLQAFPRNNYSNNNYSISNENYDKMILILRSILYTNVIDPNIHNPNLTLLSYACQTNQIDIVQMLLKMKNINVNLTVPSTGNTPLLVALICGNLEIAKLLIQDKRTDINIGDYQRNTPLSIAVKKDMNEIVDLLIKNERFDADESLLDYSFFISTGSIAKELFTLNSLDVNFIQKEQPTGFSVSVKDDFQTTLTKALFVKDDLKVDLILQHPSFNKIKSQLTKAIMISVTNNDVNNFKKLLALIDNDVNIYVTNTREMNFKEEDSLLNFALLSKNPDIINEIISNPDLKLDQNMILNVFVKLCNIFNERSKVTLMKNIYEIRKNLIDFTKLLPNGKSIFTSISNLKNIDDVVRFYISNGADPNLPDSFGVYPLQYAIKLESIQYVIALILTQKVDYTKKILDLETGVHKSYLHFAARLINPEILIELIHTDEIDINITDDNGETPLMEACRYKQRPNIEFLFTKDKLDYLHVNNKGEDALKITESYAKDKIEMKENTRECYYKTIMFYVEQGELHQHINNDEFNLQLEEEEEEEMFEESFIEEDDIDFHGMYFDDDDDEFMFNEVD